MSEKFAVDAKGLPGELKLGMEQLGAEYPVSTGKKKGAVEIAFVKDRKLEKTGGLKVEKGCCGITVNYGRKTDAFRALGRIFGEQGSVMKKPDFNETPKFDMIGVMIESSRDGVMTVENIKAFLRRYALMGLNAAMLYTEDTYEIPEQPFFGYLRGRYTQKELKEIDDYAHALGIEMIACIQTLSHLAQALQWGIAFKDVKDTLNTLLVEEEKTYNLIDQMIKAASTPFRSKRIHLGMDEAHDLGKGKYKELHGEKDTFQLMNNHLGRVVGICRKYGLRPMIWDDMFFRIGSKTHDYYDLDAKIPADIVKSIPEDVDFIDWDYYHRDYDFYAKFIDLHRKIKKEPIAAPGAQNWGRFWSNIPVAEVTIKPFMKACRDKGVRQALMTTWGDNGMENDIYSTLAPTQLYAEYIYSDSSDVDEKLVRANFLGTCKASYDDYRLASMLDYPVKTDKPREPNPSKWLLWDDMLIGLCEPLQEGRSFKKHYARLAADLKKKIGADPASMRLEFPMQLAKVISMKCDLRKELVAAYRKKDRIKLSQLLKTELKPLHAEMKKLWLVHRRLWLSTYKPFGLEYIEVRYGTLLTRTQTLIDRLEQYLKGEVADIPEFDSELLNFMGDSKGYIHGIWDWRRIATPSSILVTG